jgi:hypothetical protein
METPEPERERKKPALVKDIFEPSVSPLDLPFPAGANFTAYQVRMSARNDRWYHTDSVLPRC